MAEIAKISSLPVNVVVISHSDPEHINGLPAFPAGVQVIAQENARSEMVEALANPHPDFTPPPPALKDYLPTRTVRDRADLTLDGVHLILLHPGPAHTDGDLMLYLPAQKIVFAGDILDGSLPGIHPKKHGSFLGWVAFMKAMLALDADIFISGHGQPQTRADVAARIQTAEERRAEIKRMVDQHKTLDEIKHALGEVPPTGMAAHGPTFTESIYQELTAH